MPTANGAPRFDPGLILLAFAPVFLLTIAAEAWYWRRRDPAVYNLKDTVSNACLALMHPASDAFFLWLMVKSAYTWVYAHGLRAVPETGWSFALLLLLQDALYYGFQSVHRVHHARNPRYIDRNYASVLTVWDRLFGSFVPEDEAPLFGITRQIRSHNPITLTFHEWRDMWTDVLRDRDIRYLWKPPEWRSLQAQPIGMAPGFDSPP